MDQEHDEKNEVQDMKVALKYVKELRDRGAIEKAGAKPIPKKIITFSSQSNSGLKLDL